MSIATPALDALRDTLADEFKDTRLNLASVLTGENLDAAQAFGVALSAARFVRADKLAAALESDIRAGLGDAALGDMGPSRSPYGKRFLSVPIIPDDMPLTVSESVPAILKAFTFGPYQIATGVNDQLVLSVNGAAALTITLVGDTAAGSVLETRQVVAQINQALAAAGGLRAVAYDDGYGRLTIKTLDKGAAFSLALTVGGARDTSRTLGLSDGVAPVSAAGADNTGIVREGTFIMLTNPRNLLWGVLDGTRMFTEFNKDFDRIETVVYNQTDAEIENPDAMVLGLNLRRKNHVALSIP